MINYQKDDEKSTNKSGTNMNSKIHSLSNTEPENKSKIHSLSNTEPENRSKINHLSDNTNLTETYTPSSKTMGFFYQFKDQHNLAAHSYGNHKISGFAQVWHKLTGHDPVIKGYLGDEKTSTIWQVSLMDPKEFATYRKNVIEKFQEFNKIQHELRTDREALLDINNQEALRAYLKGYKGLYNRAFEGFIDEFLKNPTDYSSLDESQQNQLDKIIKEISSHLQYAAMYRGIEINNNDNVTTFTQTDTNDTNAKKIPLLTISSQTGIGADSYKTSYNISDNLDEKQLKIALNHMAEEMSQRRLFAPLSRTLNENTHSGQLLYLMKELICVRGIQIANFNIIRNKIIDDLTTAGYKTHALKIALYELETLNGASYDTQKANIVLEKLNNMFNENITKPPIPLSNQAKNTPASQKQNHSSPPPPGA